MTFQKQPDVLINKERIQFNLDQSFLFPIENGCLLDGHCTFSIEDGALNGWLNYSLNCNLYKKRHAYVYTDINDQNIETYADIEQFKKEQKLNSVFCFDFEVDDIDEKLTEYGRNIGFEKIQEMAKQDPTGKTVYQDFINFFK